MPQYHAASQTEGSSGTCLEAGLEMSWVLSFLQAKERSYTFGVCLLASVLNPPKVFPNVPCLRWGLLCLGARPHPGP